MDPRADRGYSDRARLIKRRAHKDTDLAWPTWAMLTLTFTLSALLWGGLYAITH